MKIYIQTAPALFGVVTLSLGNALIPAYKSYSCQNSPLKQL